MGRASEFAVLEAAWNRARAGLGGVVAVTGEAGVGKSRVVRALVSAAGGARVLTGRAVESDVLVPYRPLIEALLAASRDVPLPEPPGIEGFRAALGRLVPQWAGTAPSSPDPPALLVGEGLLRVLRALANREGSLVVLDDLHWADAETLAVVDYLALHLATERILLVLALRDDPPTAAMSVVGDLVAHRGATLVRLARLSTDAVDEMARRCLDVPELPVGLVRVLDRSDGVPFFVEELLASAIGSGSLVTADGIWQLRGPLAGDVPVSFAESVNRRLTLLGGLVPEILRAAAVLGRGFDWRLLAAMTGLDETTVASALRRASEAQLIETSPTSDGQVGFRFRHALTRDAVLADVLPHERAQLAAAALQAITSTYPDPSPELREVTAGLAEDAGEFDRAGRLRLEGAERALARGDLGTAEAALQRARSGVRDPELATAIEEAHCETLALAGRADLLIERAPDLLAALARVGASPQRFASAHLRLARAALTATRWDVAAGALERARVLGVDDDHRMVASALVLSAQLAIGQGRSDQAWRDADRALEVAEREDLPAVACEALEVMGRTTRFGRPADAEALFERAWVIAERNDLALWSLRAQHELGTIDLIRHARMDRLVRVREAAHRAGAVSMTTTLDLQISALHGLRMESDAAVDVARRALDAARHFGFPMVEPIALVHQGFGHACAGRPDAADRAGREALELAGADPNVAAGVWGHCRATVSLLGERHARARRELDRGMREISRDLSVVWPFVGWYSLLSALADDDVPGGQQHAGAYAGVRFVAALDAVAAAIRVGRTGDAHRARTIFAEADNELAALDSVDGFRHLARRLAAEAAIADGWGDPVAWLRDAFEFFEATPHTKVSTACRSLLRRAGDQPPRRASSRVPADLASLGVTGRELEVLRLLAERLTSSEIGERLYLSPRTVDKHVEHLMDKTGVRSRLALGALAENSDPTKM